MPVDGRGFPIPAFVLIGADGKPDHRLVDSRKVPDILAKKLCWICGQPTGKYVCFNIGPKSLISRVSGEPPSHRDCAEYAVRACPFLSRPNAKRRDNGLPDDATYPEGGVPGNPGCAVTVNLTAKDWQTMQSADGCGVLFPFDNPIAVGWWTEGRPATQLEIDGFVGAAVDGVMEMTREDLKGIEQTAEAVAVWADLSMRLAFLQKWGKAATG